LPVLGAAPSSDNFFFSFVAGSTTDSNVIKDDGLGTDMLSGVYNGKYSVSAGTVQGDITGPGGAPDGKVDIEDLSAVGSKFGLKSSGTGWDSSRDVVQNGEIDVYDMVFVGSRFT
jgi:hypothetical protein